MTSRLSLYNINIFISSKAKVTYRGLYNINYFSTSVQRWKRSSWKRVVFSVTLSLKLSSGLYLVIISIYKEIVIIWQFIDWIPISVLKQKFSPTINPIIIAIHFTPILWEEAAYFLPSTIFPSQNFSLPYFSLHYLFPLIFLFFVGTSNTLFSADRLVLYFIIPVKLYKRTTRNLFTC